MSYQLCVVYMIRAGNGEKTVALSSFNQLATRLLLITTTGKELGPIFLEQLTLPLFFCWS